jgi:hypothetical protein
MMLYRRHAGQITRDPKSWRQEWEMVVGKMRHLAPAEVAATQNKARSNNNRYWARLAYESRSTGADSDFFAQASPMPRDIS